jgi:TMEM175 potassium channel family protein
MTKSRLEAFSDGVIAVAITLLVLNLTVPTPPQLNLASKLLRHWPEYAAYAISFFTIGIIWINHHAMIGRLREVDHAILFLNLLLLFWIAVLPFATNLMASYLREQHGENLAAAVYAGSLLLMALTFALLNHHLLVRKAHLLNVELSEEQRRALLARTRTGLIPYAVATPLALLSPYITLAICGAIAVFYALPRASNL